MAITRTQGINGSGATIALTSVVSGALLTLQTSFYRAIGSHAGEATPTDTQGTWSVGVTSVPALFNSGTDDVGSSIFYQANVASGTHTVTPQVQTSKHRTLTEWASVLTTSPFDVAATAKIESTNHTSQATGTTGTTAQANEMVLIGLAFGALTGTTNVGFTDPVSGFTTLQTVSNSASDLATFHAWQTISATGTQSATFNWTAGEAGESTQACIATFKEVAAAGGSSIRIRFPPMYEGMGVGGMLGGSRV